MEIERKFLVNSAKWYNFPKDKGELVIQGYLACDNFKSIRMRLKGEKGYITIKSNTVNISREEFEFPVDKETAIEIINKFSESRIEKIRFTIAYKGKFWEIDEFLGENKGLIIAEVELESENEQIEIPEWIDKEVSNDTKYYNNNLSKYPYIEWK